VAVVAESFDLGRLRLTPGEGRRLELDVPVGDFCFAGERYAVTPAQPAATLDVSRMTGNGYALRLRLAAALAGPCMRCLEDAAPVLEVDAREVEQPGGGEELESPYVHDEVLDLRGWARDALMLALGGEQILCRTDCAGLCPECGENLNLDPGHAHERTPDPRWAKLGELRLDQG
jgi:uncharacterized protein